LVQAFASIAGDFPEWSLCILGDGPERPGLQALVDRFQLGERVKMPGSVADVMPQMAAAHAFVLSSRLEGFPNVLLEAMACGLPVVAFDCPSGPSDIVTHEHDGLLVPAGDVDRLSAAMAQVMSRPADRERMGRNAREIATRLAPERILEIWSALLQPFGG
jgi:glycosyltransferase involved in cell wall biosynthesis